MRHPQSNYGSWIDFAAPYSEDDGSGILSTVSTEAGSYGREDGTSQSTPQVAGLAALLTSLGYTNNEVYDFIKNGATDLLAPGYDNQTGWGRINVGQSMALAQRTTPGMAVVPNAGKVGVQWFNLQGSGFAQSGSVNICYTPPNGLPVCSIHGADGRGVVGLAIQINSDTTGIWSAYMCDVSQPQQVCTPSKTFTVLP